MMRSLAVALVSGALFTAVRAATVELWWNISYATVNPDQLQSRQVIGVNGTWPLPIVEANQGDTVLLHAYNGLGNVGTGLHTHGIYFNTSTYMDGATFISQCPIPPGETFDYVIPTAPQSGTYWIHGHYAGQYVDGLRTPFIIYPTNETYKVDADYTVTVADWYHDTHAVLIKQFLNIFNPTGAEPVPDSGVAYVARNGVYPTSLEQLGQGYNISAGALTGAEIYFEPGKTYRLRFVSMSSFTMFNIHMTGHNMSIIEMDGVETEPYPVDIVPLSAAQRVSVLVKALNDTSNNYPLTLNMQYGMFDMVPDALAPLLNVTLPIVYNNDSNTPMVPEDTFDDYPTFWDYDLVPLEVEAMAPSDVFYNFTIAFDTYDDGTNRASMLPDQNTFVLPPVPSVLTELTMGEDSLQSAVYGAQTNALVLNHLDNIEIYIFNSDSNSHPFHLHGHKFQVVWMSQDITSNDTTVNPDFVDNQPNPARRDTVMIPAGGAVTIMFRADNPGAWLFHCHIEWHFEAGLAVLFIEAPLQAQETTHPPQYLLDQCEALGIPINGNVVGLNSTTDFSGEPWGPFTQYYLMGWTTKAKGALAGCILSALLGIACVVWYSVVDPFNAEEHVIRAHEEVARESAKGKFGPLSQVFQRGKGKRAAAAADQ